LQISEIKLFLIKNLGEKDPMETLMLVFQIILAILIVLIVLVNVTKGSEYGAVFRGAEAIFGGAGPTSFLNKVTMLLVVLFFLNSLLLTKISSSKHKLVLPEKVPTKSAPGQAPPIPSPIPLPPKDTSSPTKP